MLSLIARQGALARQLLPAAAFAASTHVQERGMKLFEVGCNLQPPDRRLEAQQLGFARRRRLLPAAVGLEHSSAGGSCLNRHADLQQGGAGEAQGPGAGGRCTRCVAYAPGFATMTIMLLSGMPLPAGPAPTSD